MSTGNPRQLMKLQKPSGKRRLHLRKVADDDSELLNYEGVGRDLRAARLDAGLERHEVAAKLHIKRSYVHAIEDGNFGKLPASVYAYGFVRSYAGIMGLDEDLVIRRFKNEWRGLGTSTRLEFPGPPEETRLPGGPLIAVSCMLAVIAYGGWYYLSHQDRIDLPRVSIVPEQLVPAVASTADGLTGDELAMSAGNKVEPLNSPPIEAAKSKPAAPQKNGVRANLPVDQTKVTKVTQDKAYSVASKSITPPSGAVLATTTVGPAETLQPAKYGGANTGRIILRARADTWVRVQADEDDGQVYLGRILHAGDEFRLPDRDDLLLMTGNAGGLEIMVDGKKVAGIGSLGMVRRRVLLDPMRLLAGTAVDEN